MSHNILSQHELELELQDAGDQLIIIDFYATWCGPCKLIESQLQDLALRYVRNVKFLKINVDDCEDIAMMYNVTSMPTFVFMKDQQIVDVLVGGNVEKLLKSIENYVEGTETPLKVEADLQKDQNNNVHDLQDARAAVLDVADDENPF